MSSAPRTDQSSQSKRRKLKSIFPKLAQITLSLANRQSTPQPCPILHLPSELLTQILQYTLPHHVHILADGPHLRHITYVPDKNALEPVGTWTTRHPARHGLWRHQYPARVDDGAISHRRRRSPHDPEILGPRGNHQGPLAAACTCRRLRDILLPALYEAIAFDFNSPRTFAIFLARVPSANRARIRELSLGVDVRNVVSVEPSSHTWSEKDIWEGWRWSGLVDAMAAMTLRRLYVFGKGEGWSPGPEEAFIQPLKRIHVPVPDAFWVVLIWNIPTSYHEQEMDHCSFRLLKAPHTNFRDEPHPPGDHNLPGPPPGYDGNDDGVRDEFPVEIWVCRFGQPYPPFRYDPDHDRTSVRPRMR